MPLVLGPLAPCALVGGVAGSSVAGPIFIGLNSIDENIFIYRLTPGIRASRSFGDPLAPGSRDRAGVARLGTS